MHVACVNQDRGIDPGRKKGAAIHLAAMRSAFGASGARVSALDEPDAQQLVTRLEQLHEQEPVTLIYERYALDAYAASRFAARCGIPHVLEVNAPLAEEARRHRGRSAQVDERAEHALFSRARLVLAVSSTLGDWSRARGAHSDAVWVRANAVDADLFRPASELDGLTDLGDSDGGAAADASLPLVVGFHGRVRPWHGIERVAAAVAAVVAEGVPARLVCIGEGDYDERVLPLLDSAHYTHRGWMPQSQVAQEVARFDVLALGHGKDATSDCGFYFSPLKLLEAMACAVVPVVPRLGDLDQVVDHGRTGLVYTAGEERELAHALQRLWREPELRRELGRNACQAARQRSWKALAQEVLQHVTESLPSTTSRGAASS